MIERFYQEEKKAEVLTPPYVLKSESEVRVCPQKSVAQLCPTLCDPMDLSLEFSKPEYWSEQPFPSPEDLPNPRIEPRSPALRADSLPTEPQGKPRNTGVGSLFLLQGIIPTQELNLGHPHCRWILYQLSYREARSCVTELKSVNPHNYPMKKQILFQL